jgi:hypothetical protein
MTPVREAFVLPLVFLTVALLGGLRVGDEVRLVPPPLMAIVLVMLLFGTFLRAGVLLPHRLVHATRSPVENISGLVVLLTLFAASTQAVNLVLPERGLLHAGVGVLLFVQFITMNAARPDRPSALRALATLFGSLFVLRFIVLESLYSAEAGVLKRVLTAALAGVSLGGVEYQAHASITGYVAFLTLALYVFGLILLPGGHPSEALVRTAPPSRELTRATGLVLAIALTLPGCGGTDDGARAGAAAAPPPAAGEASAGNTKEDAFVPPERRASALRAARVWRAPATPISKANLGQNPVGLGAFRDDTPVTCRLVLTPVGGTTPKFNCQLPDGTTVKVKYGEGNAELRAEVAASRLLGALGFGADQMYLVPRVACAGCPLFTFRALRCLQTTGLEHVCFPGGVDYRESRNFEPAAIERRLEGEIIEAAPGQGWAWYELDQIDVEHGGSPRHEVDGLRLLAAFLAHWDNKAENQRLVCLPGGSRPDGSCAAPFAIVQDLGATFGPNKMDLHNWRNTPVWADAKTCRVSMERLPFEGGTFPERQISEKGRQFLLGLLSQLSQPQIFDLFDRSGVTTLDGVTTRGRDPDEWVQAFADKVEQIRSAGPCP